MKSLHAIVLAFVALPWLAAVPLKVRPQTIDAQIQVGYGLAIADVDGDRKPDILLADAKQVVWYRAPRWEKFVMAENLAPRDNVCIAAQDLDGDGKAEVAVGAEWNPGDTLNSGAVFLLEAPVDRAERWRAIRLPNEPTTHRMHWMQDQNQQPFLAVLPLHGRGNKNNEGVGVQFLGYPWPWKEDSKPFVMFDRAAGLHATHNFDVLPSTTGIAYVATNEGVRIVGARGTPGHLAPFLSSEPTGEVRIGQRAGAGIFMAAIEPMHGNRLVVFRPGAITPGATHSPATAARIVLDEGLIQGHALALGDVLGDGTLQVVAGWRGSGKPGEKVGIKLYAPTDDSASTWAPPVLVDDNQMACEDLKLADLDGDGRLDIIAAGRATRNVVIYWNEGAPAAKK